LSKLIIYYSKPIICLKIYFIIIIFLICCEYSKTFAQSDSTYTLINILATEPNDSLYQLKKLLNKNIPELIKWEKDINIATNNEVSLCAFLKDTSFSTANCDSCFYEIYVGLDYPDITFNVEHFLINKRTGKFFVYDIPDNRSMTLKEWRKKHKNERKFR